MNSNNRGATTIRKILVERFPNCFKGRGKQRTLGIPSSTIDGNRKRLGLPPIRKFFGHQWTPDQVEALKIACLDPNLPTWDDVGRAIGTTARRASDKRLGMKLPSLNRNHGGSKQTYSVERLIALFNGGMRAGVTDRDGIGNHQKYRHREALAARSHAGEKIADIIYTRKSITGAALQRLPLAGKGRHRGRHRRSRNGVLRRGARRTRAAILP